MSSSGTSGPGRNQEFRAKYRSADVFLMDDVQFIAGRDSTQEEMFHTFNTLYEDKKQIVFTADRPPKEMLRLEDRLKTRFEWGLLADIQPPDYETRMAIIKNKAIRMGVELPEEVLIYVAENVTSNVRQIEGTVNKDPRLPGPAGQQRGRQLRDPGRPGHVQGHRQTSCPPPRSSSRRSASSTTSTPTPSGGRGGPRPPAGPGTSPCISPGT